jgi:hypothetical protein
LLGDEDEHEILVHLTKRQVELEKTDAYNQTWAQHWKSVTVQLKEQGYDRTLDNCRAYWDLINGENGAIGSGIDGDNDDDRSSEFEDVLPSGRAVTFERAPQRHWSQDEYENLFATLRQHRELEEDLGLEPLRGQTLWTAIAAKHKENGYDRSYEGCRNFWQRQGRERSGWDESRHFDDRRKRTNQNIHSSTAKPSTAKSKSWSSVNGSDVDQSSK